MDTANWELSFDEYLGPQEYESVGKKVSIERRWQFRLPRNIDVGTALSTLLDSTRGVTDDLMGNQ